MLDYFDHCVIHNACFVCKPLGRASSPRRGDGFLTSNSRLRKVPASCGKPPYASGRFLQIAGSLRTPPEGSCKLREASVRLRNVSCKLREASVRLRNVSCKLREASVRLRKVPASCGKPLYASGRFLQVAGSLRTPPERFLQVAGSLCTPPEREFDISNSFADAGMGRPCTMPASMLCATHNARFVCKPLGRASSPRWGDRFLTSNSR